MSTAIWKFHVKVPSGTFGDVALAFRSAGFSVAEATQIEDAIFATTELRFSVPKDSLIDPVILFENLAATGLIVKWANRPAA